MVEPLTKAEPSVWDAPHLRQAARLTLRFVLDIAQISRGAGDVLDTILLAAILDANHAPIHRDAALARLYADPGRAPPDELRRPISVNALAKSLRLPFESVRRRIGGLVGAGHCVRTAVGVYVPEAAVTSPAYLAIQQARIERLRAFHADLVRARFIAPAGAAIAPISTLRAADRALGRYVLRTCELLIELAHSPVTGFVFLGLAVAGVPEEGVVPAPRRPARLGAISARLGMAPETVRRHLLALAELGFARQTLHGWTAAAPPDGWPRLFRLVAQNEANLRRLFEQVQSLEPAR